MLYCSFVIFPYCSLSYWTARHLLLITQGYRVSATISNLKQICPSMWMKIWLGLYSLTFDTVLKFSLHTLWIFSSVTRWRDLWMNVVGEYRVFGHIESNPRGKHCCKVGSIMLQPAVVSFKTVVHILSCFHTANFWTFWYQPNQWQWVKY